MITRESVWKPKGLPQVKLKDMTDEHLEKCIHMLERRGFGDWQREWLHAMVEEVRLRGAWRDLGLCRPLRPQPCTRFTDPSVGLPPLVDYESGGFFVTGAINGRDELEVGDWIVYYSEDSCEVLTDEEFREKFDLTKAPRQE